MTDEERQRARYRAEANRTNTMLNETDLSAWDYYDQELPLGLSQYLIIGREACGYCVKAKDLLGDVGIPYDYKDIYAISVQEREYLEEIAGAPFKTVPQIFIYQIGGGIAHVGGYNELISSLL
jgi:glutaredoxin 1